MSRDEHQPAPRADRPSGRILGTAPLKYSDHEIHQILRQVYEQSAQPAEAGGAEENNPQTPNMRRHFVWLCCLLFAQCKAHYGDYLLDLA